MTLQYSIATSSDPTQSGITIIYPDGHIDVISQGHPEHDNIRDIITNTPLDEIDEANIRNLAKPIAAVGIKLTTLSERVSTDGNRVYFDGDVVDGVIEEHILRAVKEDGNTSPHSLTATVKFLEKLATNPSEASRQALYNFIQRYKLTLTSDGDFIAYKGLRQDSTSIHAGYGVVDKKTYDGHLPNSPGSVVEFPRQKVDADSNNACSVGLHAGSYEYAKNFAQGVLVTVKINPRDVVSVPTDHDYSKLRVARYEVITSETVEIPTTTYTFVNHWEDDHSLTALTSLIEEHGEVPVFIDGDHATATACYYESDRAILIADGDEYYFDEIDDFEINYADLPDSDEDDEYDEEEEEDDTPDESVLTDLLTATTVRILKENGEPKYEVELTSTSLFSFADKTYTGKLLTLTPEEVKIEQPNNVELTLPRSRVRSIIIKREL